MPSYPPFPVLVEKPNKNRMLEVRRAPVSMMSMIFVFLASVIGAYLLTVFLQEGPLRFISTSFLSPRIFALVPLVLLLEILRRLHNDLYIFSQHRLTHLRGRFSLSYNVPVIKYIDIRAINVVQDFWGRIFNYGDISVGTAAHEGNEILISGVKAPEELAMLLDQLRTNSLRVESAEMKTQHSTSATSD